MAADRAAPPPASPPAATSSASATGSLKKAPPAAAPSKVKVKDKQQQQQVDSSLHNQEEGTSRTCPETITMPTISPETSLRSFIQENSKSLLMRDDSLKIAVEKVRKKRRMRHSDHSRVIVIGW
jgi:hypothetical protein